MNKQDGTNEQPGIIPRALKELFVQASSEDESLTFSMSMLEVFFRIFLSFFFLMHMTCIIIMIIKSVFNYLVLIL